MTEYYLSAIYIYPVKSFSGISVNLCEVTDKGLQYDRKWMLVDQNNQFLSQRKLPEMTLIKTSIIKDHLQLSAPGMEDVCLPLNTTGGEKISTRIWQDGCTARLISPEIDQWLSDFLHTPCQLVYQPEETVRLVDQNFATQRDKVFFSDGFPFLILSDNSLVELNREMDIDLPMSRFRPNLVIGGCEGYAEDYWRNISIGKIDFRLPKPCSRCSITTIAPETAQSGKEPLKTLNRLRKWNRQVYFGQNALHDNYGIVKVGDPVTINKTGQAQPPLSLAPVIN